MARHYLKQWDHGGQDQSQLHSGSCRHAWASERGWIRPSGAQRVKITKGWVQPVAGSAASARWPSYKGGFQPQRHRPSGWLCFIKGYEGKEYRFHNTNLLQFWNMVGFNEAESTEPQMQPGCFIFIPFSESSKKIKLLLAHLFGQCKINSEHQVKITPI